MSCTSYVLRFATLLALLRHEVWPELLQDRATISKWIPSYAGPFIMYLDRMYECPTPNKENMFEVHVRPSHFRTPALIQTTLQTIDGNATWKVAVDDTWAGHLKSDVWANNQWKENSIVYPIPKAFCSTVRSSFPGVFEAFYLKSAWSKEPCTFPKKTYIYDKTPLNWTQPNFPILPYGRYRSTSTVWSPMKVNHACFVLEVVVVPKL